MEKWGRREREAGKKRDGCSKRRGGGWIGWEGETMGRAGGGQGRSSGDTPTTGADVQETRVGRGGWGGGRAVGKATGSAYPLVLPPLLLVRRQRRRCVRENRAGGRAPTSARAARLTLCTRGGCRQERTFGNRGGTSDRPLCAVRERSTHCHAVAAVQDGRLGACAGDRRSRAGTRQSGHLARAPAGGPARRGAAALCQRVCIGGTRQGRRGRAVRSEARPPTRAGGG